MQIAIVLYHGMTALDAVGPYEIFRFIPDAELRFVSNIPQPIVTDSGVLVLGEHIHITRHLALTLCWFLAQPLIQQQQWRMEY